MKVDNAYAPVGWFYRVNSVFYDPSIYGRFLVVAILASLVLVLFEPSRWAWVARCVATVTWIGLLPSFSQSSFVALAVGIVVALTVLWRRRAIVPLAVAAAAARRRHARRAAGSATGCSARRGSRTRPAAAPRSSRTASSSSSTTR